MSVRDLLRANDERFRAVADGFDADDWRRPSLCEDWSNHEVLAHLVVGVSAGAGLVVAEMIRHAGSFDRANTAMARALAVQLGPAELLDEFDHLSRGPRGLGRYFPARLLLGDHVTHELDILFALERELSISQEAAIAVLNSQVALPNPFVSAFRNSRGLRLVATDAEWTHGEHGPLVEGRAVELISVLGNRPRVLPRLRGDGVEVLASRLSRRPIRRAG